MESRKEKAEIRVLLFQPFSSFSFSRYQIFSVPSSVFQTVCLCPLHNLDVDCFSSLCRGAVDERLSVSHSRIFAKEDSSEGLDLNLTIFVLEAGAARPDGC